MLKKLFLGPILGAVFLILGTANAWAVNCSANPFTLLPGQVASATQVMANFNNLLNCANTILGTFSGPGSSTDGNAVCFNGTTGQLGKDCNAAIDNNPWIAYTPVITCNTGSGLVLANGSVLGAYKVIGKTVFFSATFQINAIGTCGNLLVTMPVLSTTPVPYAAVGRDAFTGFALNCGMVGGTQVTLCQRYDGNVPGVTGSAISITGVYQAA
jgi:hypothetical protein